MDYVTETCTGKSDLIPQPKLANKSAKASMEVFTGVKTKNFDLLEGMADKQHNGAENFTEHLENLEAEGKIAERDAALAEMHNVDTTPHETSKARKTKKKAAEIQSQAEHKSKQQALSKEQRDARYATENGIVRHKNKKYLDLNISPSLEKCLTNELLESMADDSSNYKLRKKHESKAKI